jgi:hypothetical protein
VACLAWFVAFLGAISLFLIPSFVDGMLGKPQSVPAHTYSYDLLLHSRSLTEQRERHVPHYLDSPQARRFTQDIGCHSDNS